MPNVPTSEPNNIHATQTLEGLLLEAQRVEVNQFPQTTSSVNTNQKFSPKNDAPPSATQAQTTQQIHPLFLTTHAESRNSKTDTHFDKILGFLRLILEALLKVFDILMDASIQIVKIAVWAIAIVGILIVVTLMTNTTDKFIDLINQSVFRATGSNFQIQKIPSEGTSAPAPTSTTSSRRTVSPSSSQ